MRAFAEWQPRYAEQGIATFPVKNKRPCVQGWQHVGIGGSLQLALKFPEADAFGFQCGKHNRITIIDIDSAQERMLDEAVRMFGQSPLTSSPRFSVMVPQGLINPISALV
jgi:hypothetical protein